LWSGHYSVPGAQAPIVRRRLANYAAQSAPYFTLARVFRGLPSSKRRGANGIEVSEGHLPTSMDMATCRFLFLLFQRCGA
jgi:hypothetical protein